jgi:hypothetical protein
MEVTIKASINKTKNKAMVFINTTQVAFLLDFGKITKEME